MFYSVASPEWKSGQPLAPAGALLFATRDEAATFAPDALVVAVAVRYDSVARAIRPTGRAVALSGGWSARAVGNRLGGVTVFETIPASLVQADGGERGARAAVLVPEPETRTLEVYRWDSLTMALLA